MAYQRSEQSLKFSTNVRSETTDIDWKINNFAALTEVPEAFTNLNVQFEAGSSVGVPSKWTLLMTRDEDIIGVYLKLNESQNHVSAVIAKADLIVKRNDGTDFMNMTFSAMDIKRVEKCGFSNIGTIENFLSPETNVLSRDGCLKIQFRMEIFSQVFNREHQENKVIQLRQLSVAAASNDILQSFQNGITSDAVIISNDGKEFPVHRVVLEARSAEFLTIFQHEIEQEEGNGRVVINDMGAKALDIILRHIYYGTLTDEWTDVAEEVVSAAEKYNLQNLKTYCDVTLINACTFQTALDLLQIARRHDLKTAVDDILDYIKCNISMIFL